MKDNYKKIIKEIIGPAAKEHGFTYSCSGAMNMTKPLAMYTRKNENYTQMIYIFQNMIDKSKFSFCYRGINTQTVYTCDSEEQFIDAVRDMGRQLEEHGYDELDHMMNSPFRLHKVDRELFRDKFEDYCSDFEKRYDMGCENDIEKKLALLDVYYEDEKNYSGEDLKFFLFCIAAEYGKIILQFEDSFSVWDEEMGITYFRRKDTSVVRRSTDALGFVFRTREVGVEPKFKEKYKGFLTYKEKSSGL